MKTNRLLRIALLAGALLPLPVARAADTWSLLLDTGSVNWEAVVWTKNGTPLPSGTFPEASDDVVRLSHTGDVAQLYLQGDRSFDTLEALGGTVRIRNGATNSNAASTLTVNTINVLGGTLAFNNRNTTTSGPLKVDAGALNVTGGDLMLGDYAASGSPFVSEFNVSGTTTISSSRKIGIVNPGFTMISFGSVINNGILDLASKTGGAGSIEFTSLTPFTAAVASLAGTTGVVTTSVTAAGVAPRPTLLINGNTGAVSTYSGLIEDGVATASLKVEKTGTNVQRFNNASGNTYSGGTEVSGGILTSQNTSGSAFGTGSIEVKNGGTLAAYYRMRVELGEGNSTTVRSGGVLSAGYGGTSAVAILTFSGLANGDAPILTMENGGAFQFRLNSVTGTSDQIVFAGYQVGDLVLGGNVLNVTGLEDFESPQTWKLFSFDADISGEAWWNQGLLTLGSGFEGLEGQASLLYTSDAIYLQVIPEPESLVLLSLAAGVLLLGRRFKCFSFS